MAGYTPLHIKAYETGLVQQRENFLLPNDAYPVLENAFVWRERIKRKQGYELLGRLRRIFTDINFFPSSASPQGYNFLDITGYVAFANNTNPGQVTTRYAHNLQNGDFVIFTGILGATGYNNVTFVVTVIDPLNFTIGANAGGFGAYISGGFFVSTRSLLTIEPNAMIVPGSFTMTFGGITFNDNGNGIISSLTPGNSGTINYITGQTNVIHTAGAGNPIVFSLSYYPNLPVMGLPSRELDNLNNEELVAFDTKYAYRFGATGFEEFLPGTVWTGTDYNFFWGTNYWVGDGNLKIFWVTNFSGILGDPIRYTNGVSATNWIDFSPIINAAGDVLTQCLAIVPFRSRLLTFNTYEGANLATSLQYPQRIRWAAIGNPFTTPSTIVTNVNTDAWRDDIRGEGGFLDIPTSESIVAIGFVRDNLVIYCERSTWQLRYTGRSISPFQIEKVNSELGAESTFSAVQFDTSLVGIGDKGIVECDSFKSERIDIKIPDLVFQFTNDSHGPQRVHGIRDFAQRLAYWTYPFQSDNEFSSTYPNRRLVYNYENDSWAIFTDSLTALGTFQAQLGLRWIAVAEPWSEQNYTWLTKPSLFPSIIGGNQQGYVEYLDVDVTSDVSLYIKNITGRDPLATRIESPNHNLQNNQIIQIKDIPAATPFSSLNDQVFSVTIIDSSNFDLYVYNPVNGQFNIPQINSPAVFIGFGQILIRDNFNIVSKKFNFLDDGENIQLGFIDILMDNTTNGEISLNVYLDYNDSQPINTYPENVISGSFSADTFFNTTVPTSIPIPRGSSKNWQRVFCATRGSFITIEWTLSNAQMVGEAQQSNVQIDAQVLWMRKAGKQLPIGI